MSEILIELKRPCRRLKLTPEEATAAICDAKERGQDVIWASRCDRCGYMHMHRKERGAVSLRELCEELDLPW